MSQQPMQSPYPACPNCGSGEVIRAVNPIGTGSHIVLSAFQAVTVARLVCLHCGFVREWVDNRAELDLLRKKFGDQLRPR